MPWWFLLAQQINTRPQSGAVGPPGVVMQRGRTAGESFTSYCSQLVSLRGRTRRYTPSSQQLFISEIQGWYPTCCLLLHILFFTNVIIFNEENNILAPRQIKREESKYISCCHKYSKKKVLSVMRTIFFFHMKEHRNKNVFQLEQDQVLLKRVACSSEMKSKRQGRGAAQVCCHGHIAAGEGVNVPLILPPTSVPIWDQREVIFPMKPAIWPSKKSYLVSLDNCIASWFRSIAHHEQS